MPSFFQTLCVPVKGGRDCHQLQQEDLRVERVGDEAGGCRLHYRVRYERGVRSPTWLRGMYRTYRTYLPTVKLLYLVL